MIKNNVAILWTTIRTYFVYILYVCVYIDIIYCVDIYILIDIYHLFLLFYFYVSRRNTAHFHPGFTQTGVSSAEWALNNQTQSGRLPFVNCFHSNWPSEWEEPPSLMPRFCVHGAAVNHSTVWDVFVVFFSLHHHHHGGATSRNSHISSLSMSPESSLQIQRGPPGLLPLLSLHTAIKRGNGSDRCLTPAAMNLKVA